MYVPEIHPITCDEYHEREDDAHVLKVLHAYIVIEVVNTSIVGWFISMAAYYVYLYHQGTYVCSRTSGVAFCPLLRGCSHTHMGSILQWEVFLFSEVAFNQL